MSKVTELAKDEAERAEAENPDELTPPAPPAEEQEEDEQATPVEPPAEPTEEPPNTDAMLKAVESEMTRHEKAFAKALGVPIEALHVCTSCGGAGFTEEGEPAILDSTFTERCPDCNGYGKVKSHAVKQETFLIDCRRCTGYGYVNVLEVVTTAATVLPHETPLPPVADDPEVEALRAKGYTIIAPFQVAAQG